MGLYKDEAPLLSSNTLVDEGVGIEVGSKVVGSWAETFQAPIATLAINQSFFIAPYPVEVVAIQASWKTVAGQAATVTAEKLTGTTAPGSGTSLTSTTADLTSTINTTNTLTLATAPATLQLAKGDRIGALFTGTTTSLVGLVLSVVLKRI